MLFCKILSISSRWQENQYFPFPAGKPSASEQEQRGRGETRRLRSRDWSARRPTGLVWWVNAMYTTEMKEPTRQKKHSNWSKHACKPKLMQIHWENTHLDSSPIVLSIPVFCQKKSLSGICNSGFAGTPGYLSYCFPVFPVFQYSAKKNHWMKFVTQVLLAPPDTFPRRCWRRSHMGSRLISGHVVSLINITLRFCDCEFQQSTSHCDTYKWQMWWASTIIVIQNNKETKCLVIVSLSIHIST